MDDKTKGPAQFPKMLFRGAGKATRESVVVATVFEEKELLAGKMFDPKFNLVDDGKGGKMPDPEVKVLPDPKGKWYPSREEAAANAPAVADAPLTPAGDLADLVKMLANQVNALTDRVEALEGGKGKHTK